VYPVLIACSLLAHYMFHLFEVYPNNRLDQWLMWTIMAAICGTIVGIGLITGAVIGKEKLSS
jgi:short subunit fatty acids transporter